MKQRTTFFIFGLIAGGILGAAGMGIVWQSKSNSAPSQNQSEKINTEGKVICLPHKNTDGPQTLECAAGIETVTGKVYGLSSTKDTSSLTASAGSNKKVHVTGSLQVAKDDKYRTDGTLAVESYEFLP